MVEPAAVVLADMLAGYGVTHLFQVPAVLRRILAELERRHPDVARITTHGEKAAAYMADGYARAPPGPGACRVTGARADRRPAAGDQVPPRVPGDRRPAGLRSGHQVQRLDRSSRPLRG